MLFAAVGCLRGGQCADEDGRRDEREKRAEDVGVAIERYLAAEEGQRGKVMQEVVDAEAERPREGGQRDGDDALESRLLRANEIPQDHPEHPENEEGLGIEVGN